IVRDRAVALYVDMHGHSRRKNVFMYGCDNKRDPALLHYERVLPRILDDFGPSFNYEDCTFKMQRSKEGTARLVVRKEYNVVNSFTMEASFCGTNQGKYCDIQFNEAALMEMGAALGKAILHSFATDTTPGDAATDLSHPGVPPLSEAGREVLNTIRTELQRTAMRKEEEVEPIDDSDSESDEEPTIRDQIKGKKGNTPPPDADTPADDVNPYEVLDSLSSLQAALKRDTSKDKKKKKKAKKEKAAKKKKKVKKKEEKEKEKEMEVWDI
ncbi:hypothetical protein KIPB_002289, partial [Kipferlia bialata]